jgi:hypothetical protein
MFAREDNSASGFACARVWRCLAFLLVAWTLALRETAPAGPITVPNGSFESPAAPFVSLNFDSWQRTPQPVWWDENANGPWSNLTGIFKNTAPGSADHIVNCHSNQAAWLFANPEVGLFQDYDSMDWNDSKPTHDFDVKFEIGKTYRLTLGVIGGGYNMLAGTPLQAGLYYRDTTTNKVMVATTTITHSPALFGSRTQLIYFEVSTPVVREADPWAGQHLGIQFLSTVAPALAGGFWDLDDVRLSSTMSPVVSNPAMVNGQFQFTLLSEPGVVLEILAHANPALPLSSWDSLGAVTNHTGTIPFVDTSVNFSQRFYQVRQWP